MHFHIRILEKPDWVECRPEKQDWSGYFVIPLNLFEAYDPNRPSMVTYWSNRAANWNLGFLEMDK